MQPPRPPSGNAIGTWSLQHLLDMLRDERMPSQKLVLKDGEIEVQREVFNGEPCIAKRYLGNLSERQQYEMTQLNAVGGVDSLLRHVASAYSTENRSIFSGRERTLRTRWYGLDTDSWQRMTEAAEDNESPFVRSVPTLLAWVRGVLRACEEFHSLGFVHCDLLPQNIVLRHRTDNALAGRYTLLLDQPFIIDLEFCLGPQVRGLWGPGQVRDGWFRDDKTPLCLSPNWHSELICAGEVVKLAEYDDGLIASRENRMEHKAGQKFVVLRDKPFEQLARVDWGVDLFSLGIALQDMLDAKAVNFVDAKGQAVLESDKAYRYLNDLPKLLRSYNQLAPSQQPRATPHDTICKAIDDCLKGAFGNSNECPVNLPRNFGTGTEAPRVRRTTMLTTLESVPAPKPVSRPQPEPQPTQRWLALAVAAVGLAVLGGGAAWLLSNNLRNGASGDVGASALPAVEAVSVPVSVVSAVSAPAPLAVSAPPPAPVAPPAPAPSPLIAQTLSALRAVTTAEMGTAPWQSAVGELAGVCRMAARSDEAAGCRGAWNGIQNDYLERTAQAKKDPWWKDGGYLKSEPTTALRHWLTANATLAQHGLWVAQVDQAMGDTIALAQKAQSTPVTTQQRMDAAKTLATLVQASGSPKSAFNVEVPNALQRQLRIEGAMTLWRAAREGVWGNAEYAAVAPTALALPVLQTVADMPSQQAQNAHGYALACWTPASNQPRALHYFNKALVAEDSGDAAKGYAAEAKISVEAIKAKRNLCQSPAQEAAQAAAAAAAAAAALPTPQQTYTLATPGMLASPWFKGRVAPGAEEKRWIADTVKFANDKPALPRAQFSLARLYCKPVAPSIAHNPAQCGQWMARALQNPALQPGTERDDYRQLTIQAFNAYVFDTAQRGELPDAAFARALEPGLQTMAQESLTLASYLAVVQACFRRPASVLLAKATLQTALQRFPADSNVAKAKVALDYLNTEGRFPCPGR